jgi:rubredoxin
VGGKKKPTASPGPAAAAARATTAIKTVYTPERRKRVTTWRCIGCERIYKRSLPAREVDRTGARRYVRVGVCKDCRRQALEKWNRKQEPGA